MGMNQQEDDEQSFAQGFASIADPDAVIDNTPATAEVDEDGGPGGDVVSDSGVDANESSPEGAAPESAQPAEAGDGSAASEGATAQAAATPSDGGAVGADAGSPTEAVAAEEALFAGLTQTEIRSLLAKAAKVDQLEQGLRKVHGRIGEINGRLPRQPSGEATDQAAAVIAAREQATHENVETQDIDQSVFGDYSEQALAKGIATVTSQAQKPLLERIAQLEARLTGAPTQAAASQEHDQVQQPQQAAQAEQVVDNETAFAIERGVLDRTRKGWQDTVASDDFNLWVGSDKSGDRHKSFANATTADSMAGLLDQFDKSQAARHAAAERSAKGQRRLESAITPSGSAPRPQAAPSEESDFESAFAQVRGR